MHGLKLHKTVELKRGTRTDSERNERSFSKTIDIAISLNGSIKKKKKKTKGDVSHSDGINNRNIETVTNRKNAQ